MLRKIAKCVKQEKVKDCIKVVPGGPNDPLLILEIECAAEIQVNIISALMVKKL